MRRVGVDRLVAADAALAFKADKAKKAQTIALKKGVDTNESIKVAEVR